MKFLLQKFKSVIPAKAGIQGNGDFVTWIPAFAGMTMLTLAGFPFPIF